MLNTDDFIKRLELLFEHYGMNASLFADKIGVQRSSISHLLSGRNKPSLDFILKITDVFPDVNLYWILSGKGTLLQSESHTATTDLKLEPALPPAILNDNEKLQTSLSEATKTKEADIASQLSIQPDKRAASDIHKIVIFYTDGTFEDYAKKETPNPKMD